MKWKTYLILGIFLMVGFVLAEVLISPTIKDYYFEDYKCHNYNDVLICSEKVHFCSLKPDSINDGFKECSPEIIIWNRRDNQIDIDMIKDKLDFKITKAYRNDKLDLYYSTDYEIYNEERLNETILEIISNFSLLNSSEQNILLSNGFSLENLYANLNYNVSKIRFDDWKEFDGLKKYIPSNTIVGIKLEFELPQYEKAFYNFTYKPLNFLLDPDISACGNLIIKGGNYSLTQDIIGINTNCFTILNDSITFNMSGYNITGVGAGTILGFTSNGYDNFTLKNGEIYDFFSGIQIFNSLNNNITNITSNSHILYGFLGLNWDNSYISNSIFNSNSHGIALSSSSNNIIYDNIINSNANYGFFLATGSNNNTIYNNTINSNTGIGVGVFSASNNNNLTNNYIHNCTVQFSDSDNNIMSRGILNATKTNSLDIRLASLHNRFIDFEIFGGANRDVIVSRKTIPGTCSGTFFNDVCEDITYDEACDDQEAEGECEWDIDECIEDGGDPRCSYFTSEQACEEYGPPVPDCSWAPGSTSYSLNNTFINVSYDILKEIVQAGSDLIRKWHYRGYVNNSCNDDIENVNISIYNKTNSLQTSMLTGADGFTPIYDIFDYRNFGGVRTFYSPYKMNATHNDYLNIADNVYNITLEENLKDVFQFTELNLTSVNNINCSCGYVFNTNQKNVLNLTYIDIGTISINANWTFLNNPKQIVGKKGCIFLIKKGVEWR